MLPRLARPAFVACVLLVGATAASLRADVTFKSGPAQVALVELYTSEGCSSCPPAEKWLGELRTDPGLWKNFVPVAFHVNYWDHLGWRDVLATKEFTQREYTYAEAWRAPSVYTPCFVRNGAEWHPRDDSPATRDAAAVGDLTATWRDDGTCRVTFVTTGTGKDPLVACIALLAGGLTSKVKAGENSGRELQHEFVALELVTIPLTRDAASTLSGAVKLAPSPSRPLPAFSRRALAVWITPRGSPVPRQAVGGWLPPP